MNALLPALVVALLVGCAALPSAKSAAVHDPHSSSRPEAVRVTHVGLDLELDFDRHRLTGTATLTVERSDPDAPLVLDTQALRIDGVTGVDGSRRTWRLGDENGRLGRPLSIDLWPGDERVRVAYSTLPEGEALQFLAPEQTADGRQPFLFTQGQSILTRSWIPLQDSPGVRVTYDATVVAPAALTVLMSAETRDAPRALDGGRRAWGFRMGRPIPPYLIALACGSLEERAVSPRVSIWAEPSLADAAAWEFADTEAMVQSAERLFGEYRWGRYDVLILPPAFPFGGMENPTLTFLTPTVLAGDRSLVAIIAHELAHSWSGNLVTNATWSDFWLNEGFTVYFERRIMEAVYGQDRVAMERLLDYDALVEEMATLEPAMTVLHVDLAGRHPDDGFSGVPYDKGALFLHRLEDLFGRAALDEVLRAWFDRNAFESRTTADWRAFLERELFPRDPVAAAQIDVDEWLEAPGLPADAPRAHSDALARVDRELERFAAGAAPADLATDGWVTQQWLRFVRGLPRDLATARMAALDDAFGFTRSGNSEVLAAWLELGIHTRYAATDERLDQFLMTVGRRKYLMPLYEALKKADPARARALYARARPHYHAVSTVSLDALLAE